MSEGLVGHLHHIDHRGDPAARPDIDRCTAHGDAGEPPPNRACEMHRVFGHARAERAARTAHEENRRERRLAILADPVDDNFQRVRHVRLDRTQIVIENAVDRILARRAGHQQAHAGPGDLRVEAFDNRQRILDVRAAPAGTGLRDLEVTAGCRAPAAHLDSARRHVEDLTCLRCSERTPVM